MNDEFVSAGAPAPAPAPAPITVPLRTQVEAALQSYFSHLEGDPPSHLYKLVLQEVEPPLLEIVLRYTRGNQSQAAQILGLDRGTLRKKLRQYDLA